VLRATSRHRTSFADWGFAAALGVLAALFLLQSASPLRLDNDAVDYLSRAAALADGRPLPLVWVLPGFPAILAILDRAGLGSSFYFILANCLFLGFGLLATWHILAEYPAAIRRWTLPLTLLSVPVIRNVSIPIPEAVFFGLSLLALWAMTAATSAQSRRRFLLLALAVLLTVLASSVRVAGLALSPALIWSCLAPVRGTNADTSDRHGLRNLGLVMVLPVVVLAVVLAGTDAFAVYLNQASTTYSARSVAAIVVGRIVGVFTGWGELIVNLPFSRFKSLKPVFFVVGAISASVLLYAARKPRRLSAPAIYLVSYLVMLACWPHDSPRLWMPIIPLLIGEVGSTLRRLMKGGAPTFLVYSYLAWFVLTGVAALVYTTRISLSKEEFFKLYGNNGGMASPGAPGRPPNPEDVRRYNEAARELLIRYGGRLTSRVR